MARTQAEGKAQDAAARLQEAIDRHQKSWLPLWVEERYNKARLLGLPQSLKSTITDPLCAVPAPPPSPAC